MGAMAEEKTRVDFNAPASLVQQADLVADLLDISRTRLLVDALRDEIDERVRDRQLQRRLREAYYTDSIDFETVEAILGTEEAMRMKLLRESLDREPPEPQVETALPSRKEFYSDPPSSWTPDEEDPDDESESRA